MDISDLLVLSENSFSELGKIGAHGPLAPALALAPALSLAPALALALALGGPWALALALWPTLVS